MASTCSPRQVALVYQRLLKPAGGEGTSLGAAATASPGRPRTGRGRGRHSVKSFFKKKTLPSFRRGALDKETPGKAFFSKKTLPSVLAEALGNEFV